MTGSTRSSIETMVAELSTIRRLASCRGCVINVQRRPLDRFVRMAPPSSMDVRPPAYICWESWHFAAPSGYYTGRISSELRIRSSRV